MVGVITNPPFLLLNTSFSHIPSCLIHVRASPALIALECPTCAESRQLTAQLTNSRVCPVFMEEQKTSYDRAYERMSGGPYMCPP